MSATAEDATVDNPAMAGRSSAKGDEGLSIDLVLVVALFTALAGASHAKTLWMAAALGWLLHL